MMRTLRPGFDQNVLTPVLGVMFRDTVDARTVRDGLVVSLKDPQQPLLARRQLMVNGYGVFIAHQVSRLRARLDSSPAASRRFTLTVEDKLGRYLPVTVAADLPSEGLLEPACLGASPGAGTPHVPLYSAPARTAAAGQAEVRVDLRVASDPNTPAAWARLELWLADTDTLLAEGLADDRGSALLLCALPALRDAPLHTSPPGAQAPLSNWNVRLRAFWSPAIAQAKVPDLCELHSLPEVPLLQASSPPRPLPSAVLVAGSPLVIRSDGSSAVYVGA